MKIYEFIDRYCQDILDEARESEDLYDLDGLPNEGYMTTSEGKRVPFIYIDDTKVPVADIITQVREDFLLQYSKLPSAADRYDQYMEVVELVEGEEVIAHIRNQVRRSIAKIEADVANIIDVV